MHFTFTFAQGCTRQRGGWDSNPRPTDRKSGTLPLRHTVGRCVVAIAVAVAVVVECIECVFVVVVSLARSAE